MQAAQAVTDRQRTHCAQPKQVYRHPDGRDLVRTPAQDELASQQLGAQGRVGPDNLGIVTRLRVGILADSTNHRHGGGGRQIRQGVMRACNC